MSVFYLYELHCIPDVYPWKELLMGMGRFGQVCRAGYFCIHLDSAVLFSLWKVLYFAARRVSVPGQRTVRIDVLFPAHSVISGSPNHSPIPTMGLGFSIPYQRDDIFHIPVVA